MKIKLASQATHNFPDDVADISVSVDAAKEAATAIIYYGLSCIRRA